MGWLAIASQPTLQAEFQRGTHALGYVDGSTWSFTSATLRMRREAPGPSCGAGAPQSGRNRAEAYVAVQAARTATKAIPIVFITGNPVSFGFVQSLALLQATVSPPGRSVQGGSGRRSKPRASKRYQPTFVSRAEELDTALAQAIRARADALIVSANPFFNIHKERLIALALHHHLPAVYEFRDFVEAGLFATAPT